MRLVRRGRGRPATPLSKRDLLRYVNGALWSLAGDNPSLPLFCECGRDDCILSIDVSRDDFVAARAHPASVIVVTEHQDRFEPVLERFDSFLVVGDGESVGEGRSDADGMPDGLQL